MGLTDLLAIRIPYTQPGIAQCRRQLIHLIIDGLIHNTGVDLSGADLCVPEHFADRFERHAVGERDGRRKRVAREV